MEREGVGEDEGGVILELGEGRLVARRPPGVLGPREDDGGLCVCRNGGKFIVQVGKDSRCNERSEFAKGGSGSGGPKYAK